MVAAVSVNLQEGGNVGGRYCGICQFRLASSPIQYDKVRHTTTSCVLLSAMTINVHYNEIYLQHVFHNLLVHILISYRSSYVLATILNRYLVGYNHGSMKTIE